MSQVPYVAYFIAPKKLKKGAGTAQGTLEHQQASLEAFLEKQPAASLLETFIENCDHKKHQLVWKALNEAVEYCLKHQAHLVISEIKNHLSDDKFITQLQPLIEVAQTATSDYQPQLYCLDQPIIQLGNIKAFSEHAKEQKKLHGELIKAGLSRTSAKSGNPHAAEVINKVNRPKVENAILFALLFQPIISGYLAKGYSQRKIVTLLNDTGFPAPEGGHWVLSQFQKVLERMKYCETAITLEKRFKQYEEQHLAHEDIAEHLNKMDIPTQKGKY